MSYTCTLYTNTSNPNVISKSISKLADVECDFKRPVDVENPEIYISAGASYDKANYMYIAEFGRYYFCKGVVGPGNVITFNCVSDPLMSFKSAILTSPVVIARNPWKYDKYLHDSRLPVESRTVRSSFKFPNATLFDGSNNCYILTTIGSGA